MAALQFISMCLPRGTGKSSPNTRHPAYSTAAVRMQVRSFAALRMTARRGSRQAGAQQCCAPTEELSVETLRFSAPTKEAAVAELFDAAC